MDAFITSLRYPHISCITKERLYLLQGTDVINRCVNVKKKIEGFVSSKMIYFAVFYIKKITESHGNIQMCR